MSVQKNLSKQAFSPDCVIVTIAPEIALKSNYVKKFMVGALRENISLCIKNVGAPYSKMDFVGGRVFISSSKPNAVVSALEKCFGIHSFYLAQGVKFSSFNDLACRVALLSKGKLKETFAARAKSFSPAFRSQELEREIGSEVLALNPMLKVNLSSPKTQVNCIAYEKCAYVYFESLLAAGGMPVGTQGRVALISSKGLDKDALGLGWLLMKNGCKLSFLDFSKKTKEKDLSGLAKWSSFSGIKMTSIADTQKLYAEQRVRALFSTARTLKEAEEVSKKIGSKVFAPFLLLEAKTPFD